MNTVATPARRGRHRSAPAPADRRFRGDIEGLRAVAVLVVVAFHAGMPGIGGGFVGVDVFFVISGFLITGALWREFGETGTVRLARFYGARARRLLPAACLVLVATAIASAALLPPLRVPGVLRDAAASAVYLGNYRFAQQGTDYLAADTDPSPFQHYWSLGVEEQFYLVWPPLILGVAWLVRRLGRRTVPLLPALTAIAGLSFALSLAWTTRLPSWAFFSLPTRAWELAAGGLCALALPVWRQSTPTMARILGWTGLASIALACLRLGESTPYPGSAALLPVLGAVLVIGAGCAHPDTGAGAALSLPPVRALGRLSYSWYLWHWPVLLLAPIAAGHALGLPLRVAAVAISFGLAMLTLQLIENPVRFAPALRRSARASLTVGGVATAIALGTAVLLTMTHTAPVGAGAAQAPTIAAAPPPTAADPAAGLDAAVAQVTAQAQAAVAAATGPHPVPANLTPSLADAAGDKPDVFDNGCVRSWLDLGQAECASGDVRSSTTVAMLGDSHAAMWQPAFEQIADQRHWRLETLGKVTCPPMELQITSPYLGRPYTECVHWRHEVVSRVRTEHPALVVIGLSRRYGGDFGFTMYGPEWTGGLATLVRDLRAAGSAVLVLGPVPDPHSTVPTCLSSHLDDASACAPATSAGMNPAGIVAEQAAVIGAGGRYADLTNAFCTTAQCPVVVGNSLVFRDDNHLTIGHARALAPVVEAWADRALGPR